MSTTHGQAEQALPGCSIDGDEVDPDAPFRGHLMDWDNLDGVTFEELNNLAESWNNPTVDVASEAPEVRLLFPPFGPAAANSDRESEADKDASGLFGTPSSTVSLLPNVDSYAVEESCMPTRSLNDLGFLSFGLSESSGNDPFIVENVNRSTILNDFDSPPNSPKVPTPAIGTNDGYSETNYVDPVEPSQTKSIRLAKMNPYFNVNVKYTPLSTKPRPWHIFTYTEHGELNPENLFTAAEIQHYLWRHPLHQECHYRRSSPLTLRIHRNPPASRDRYPANYGSHRCRFHECPADNNTIDKGQFIVMFDELSAIHPDHDPYLTAGYVHLYCLERFLDFPKICATLNVQTEKRRLDKETKNMMKLDPKQVEEEADNFIETCRESRRRRPDGYPSYKERSEVTGKPYEGTLAHRMHLAKLTNRSGSINKQEAVRDKAAGQKGGSLGSHLGDLVLATTLRQSTRKHMKQNQLVANPRQKRRYKGDGFGDEDESDKVEPSHGKGDERLEKLRYPLPRLFTSTAYMLPSTTQQLGGHRFPSTSGNKTLSLAPQYPLYQLNENRKFILPTEDLLSPDPLLQPLQYCQPQQRHQSSNAQTHANVPTPAPRVEHQQHRGLETSRQSNKRSSDEAGNDEGANHFGGRIAKLFPQNNFAAGARPFEKVKDSHTSVPLSLAQKQAHQRQALLKQNNSRPPPPPPARPQAPQVLHRRRANEAGSESTSTQVDELTRLSTLGADIERDERKLKKLKQTHGRQMKVPALVTSHHGNQMQHTQSVSMSPASISGPDPAPPAAPSLVPFTGPPALQSQSHPQKLLLPIVKRKRISDEAGLVFDKDIFENPKKRPRVVELDFQSHDAKNQRALSGNMIPPVRQSSGHQSENCLIQPQAGHQWRPATDQYGTSQPGHPLPQYLPLGHQQGHTSAQHHPYNLQQGHYPTQPATHSYYSHGHLQQRLPQGYQPEQASETPETRRHIHENYDRYTQQKSRRETPKYPKPRKRPAEVLGNDGKVIKKKQRMATKIPEMVIGGFDHKKLSQEQEKLYAEARLRADEERAARQMAIIEQEEAKLRAEDEQFARQREQNKREKRER